LNFDDDLYFISLSVYQFTSLPVYEFYILLINLFKISHYIDEKEKRKEKEIQ